MLYLKQAGREGAAPLVRLSPKRTGVRQPLPLYMDKPSPGFADRVMQGLPPGPAPGSAAGELLAVQKKRRRGK